MQKQAPSLGRIVTMVAFALSCFGLLLFLWLSFGGPIPFKAQSYRMTVAVPEATQLGLEADVRISGVTVGKVRKKELAPDGNRTLATIEIDPEYAPIARDSRAILRQKTLLGETYLELTPGGVEPNRAPLEEGGRLPDAQVEETTELDEVLEAFDPTTRQAFRRWQQDLGRAVGNRGQDLNDVIGNLPEFAADGADLLRVLNTQEGAVRRLVRNTGTVFGALTEREDQLRNVIVNSQRTFSATAEESENLAESIRIFPTFLDESRITLARLQTFANETRPFVRELRPVAADLRPTIADVRRLAPDLRQIFRDLDPLITVSRTGLPALRQTLDGARPLLAELAPFLDELNPILQWLELHQGTVSDFFTNGPSAIADTIGSATGGTGHYLRQYGPTGQETLSIYRERIESNRGNAYLAPGALVSNPRAARFMIPPNFDCKPSGGERLPDEETPGCFVQVPPEFQGQRLRFTHIRPAERSEGDTGATSP